MINNQIPTVKKINKNAVALVAALLVGGYLFFGLKGVFEKHEITPGYTEINNTQIDMDAPRFIQSRSYNDVTFTIPKVTETPTAQVDPATYTVTENFDDKPIGTTPVPDNRPKPGAESAPVYTPTRIDTQVVRGGGTVVDTEWLKNNSPSGWDDGSQSSYGGGSTTTGAADYTVPTLNMPSGDQLMAALAGQGTQTSSRDKFRESVSQHEDVYLQESIATPKSPYQIMAGSVIPCALISGINSDLPGDIIAQVRGPVYDSTTGRHLLIPHGTKFIGAYDSGVVFGQQRCLFAWKRMIFPNGRSIQLQGMTGADLAGYSGIKDSVDYHYMRLTGAILMSSFLAVGTEKLDNGDTFRSTMAEDANRSGQKIVDMQLNVQPTLKIAPATPFNIMVNKDIVLTPYNKG